MARQVFLFFVVWVFCFVMIAGARRASVNDFKALIKAGLWAAVCTVISAVIVLSIVYLF